MNTWSDIIGVCKRVALTAAVVVGVGAAIVVLSPAERGSEGGQGEGVGVQSSRADVLWPLMTARSHTQRFAGALDDLGHEPPRVFDLNGNEVFFSTRTTHKRPDELVAEYQRAFVERGINSRIHRESTQQLSALDPSEAVDERLAERAAAAVEGEILPEISNSDYMLMTGMLMRRVSRDSPQALADEQLDAQADKVEAAADRLSRAYEACEGRPELVELDEIDPKGYPADLARRVERAARKEGVARQEGSSCQDQVAGVCNEPIFRLTQASRRLQAYSAALEAQPELGSCGPLRAAGFQSLRESADDFTDKLTAFRSIEAFRDKKSGKTVVTASWSDEDFDMEAMRPSEFGYPEGARFRDEVPICASCEPAWSFGGNGPEQPYSSNIVWSEEPVAQVDASYRRLMAREGWAQLDATPVEQELLSGMRYPRQARERWLRFVRGNRRVTMRIRPDPDHDRTEVTAFTSD